MNEPIVVTYAIYLAVSVALTVWVAHTLFKNGRTFLVDVFKGNEALADSINHLLVVGFYLINLGYISLALKLGYDVANARDSIEALSRKVGLVLVVLGVMHFFNLFLFSAIRGWGRGRHVPGSYPRAPASPVSPTWMPAGPAAPNA